MESRKLALLVVFGVLALGVAGCVSNGKYNKDMNGVRSQLQLVQSDVENLRTGQQKVEDEVAEAAKAKSSGGSVSGASISGEIYRTPSGFTLPSRDIQRALKNAGYYNGPVDGKIGSATRSAIKQFQEDQGLSADGVCGRRTWSKLQPFLEGAVSKAAASTTQAAAIK
ncbi:MAG: peptidoglycan-binding protein [Candidatus Omnitrophica bacterium]|nr:peptidoglycan-binding protein [Candidatus Omnitrophota bacterium]